MSDTNKTELLIAKMISYKEALPSLSPIMNILIDRVKEAIKECQDESLRQHMGWVDDAIKGNTPIDNYWGFGTSSSTVRYFKHSITNIRKDEIPSDARPRVIINDPLI